MKKTIIYILVVLGLLVGGFFALNSYIYNEKQEDGEVIACTMDAFQCPDGEWVGRTGPNCQFVCK